ncbi:MAG: hypothetical protein MMC33_007659 [Icmadophila ericetorum]|nr:hypothetical protein [Icmadophila ericetorum]
MATVPARHRLRASGELIRDYTMFPIYIGYDSDHRNVLPPTPKRERSLIAMPKNRDCPVNKPIDIAHVSQIGNLNNRARDQSRIERPKWLSILRTFLQPNCQVSQEVNGSKFLVTTTLPSDRQASTLPSTIILCNVKAVNTQQLRVLGLSTRELKILTCSTHQVHIPVPNLLAISPFDTPTSLENPYGTTSDDETPESIAQSKTSRRKSGLSFPIPAERAQGSHQRHRSHGSCSQNEEEAF